MTTPTAVNFQIAAPVSDVRKAVNARREHIQKVADNLITSLGIGRPESRSEKVPAKDTGQARLSWPPDIWETLAMRFRVRRPWN